MTFHVRVPPPGNVSNLNWADKVMTPPSGYEKMRIKASLTLDREHGVIRWGAFVDKGDGEFPAKGRIKCGDIAGNLRPDGYRIIQLAGKRYPAGRIAWFLLTDEWPKGVVRFADRITENLRPNNIYDTGSPIPARVQKRMEEIENGIFDQTMEDFALAADGKREAQNLLDGESCAHHLVRRYLRHLGVEPEGKAEIRQEPRDEDYRDARTALALS